MWLVKRAVTLEKVPNRAIRFAVLDSYNVCCRINVPMEIQQHDDKVTPIKALLFEEMKSDSVYGKSLGTVVETQASQLWLVVARGNVESMPALSMGSPEASLFPEIKTGCLTGFATLKGATRKYQDICIAWSWTRGRRVATIRKVARNTSCVKIVTMLT